MLTRRAISPFIATVLLVAITIALGGLLYTQFRQGISSQIRNPSISLVDTNVASDRQTITLLIKNDGNVAYNVTRVIFSYGLSDQTFDVGSTARVLTSSVMLKPGELIAVRFKIANPLPNFSTFTVTIVTDQIARAFTLEG